MDQQSTNETKYQTTNVFLKYALDQFYSALIKMLPAVDSALDAGSGEGYGAVEVKKALHNLDFYGIDYSLNSLLRVPEIIPDLPVAVADAKHLPFADNSFDLVISLEVLEHILTPRQAVLDYKRVSRNYMLLSVPNEPLFRLLRMARGDNILQLGNHPEHVNHWNLLSFQSFLRSCGLQVIDSTSPVPFIWSIVLCKV